MPGEIRDRRRGARLKGVYKMVVRAAMMCGLETAALTKRQEVDLEVADLKVSLGVTRNYYIRGTAQAEWSGHVQRDSGCTEPMMVTIELPGRRKLEGQSRDS